MPPQHLLPFPVVDAHLHLWDPDRNPYPWLSPGSPEPSFGDHRALMRSFSVRDYEDAVGRLLDVAAGVHVEAGCADPAAETAWVAGQGSAGLEIRHVAAAPFLDPRGAEGIEAALSHPHVVGLRHRLNRDARIGGSGIVLDHPVLLGNFAVLERRGGLFELSVFPAQDDEADRLVGRFPGVRFALNHLGWPRIESGADDPEQWRRMMRTLARRPNVLLKLSMLWPISREWKLEAVRPFVREAVEIFGPERVAFGSNYPVETVMGPFGHQLEVLLRCLGDLTGDEMRQVFRESAVRFYGLDVRQEARRNDAPEAPCRDGVPDEEGDAGK